MLRKLPLSKQNQQFYRRVFSSVMVHGAGMVFGFAGSVILARTLGAEGRGVVSWLISLHILGAGMVQLGLATANRRYSAERPADAGDLFGLTVIIVLLMTLVVLPILYGIGLSDPMGKENTLALIAVLLGVPLLGMADNFGSLLVGLHRPGGYNAINITQKVSVVLLIVVMLLLDLLTPLAAVMCTMAGVVMKFGLAVWWLRDRLEMSWQRMKTLLRRIRRFMLVNYLSAKLYLITAHGLMILLGIFASAEEVGWFAASMTLIEAMNTLPRIAGMYSIPNIVRIEDSRGRARFKAQIVMVVATLLLLAAGFFWLIADWLIPFLFGEDFQEAVTIFHILLAGLVFLGVFHLLQSMINAEDSSGRIAFAPAVSAVIILGSAPFVFESYGGEGAAYVWLVANVCAMLVSAWVAFGVHRRKVHFPAQDELTLE